MDPRYATSPGHVRDRTGLIATLDTTLPESPSAHQTSLLTAAGVPAAQINHGGDAFERVVVVRVDVRAPGHGVVLAPGIQQHEELVVLAVRADGTGPGQ